MQETEERDTNPVSVSTNLHKVRPEWLALRDEVAIEPDLAIIDTHQHFWERDTARYLVGDFLEDATAGHNVVASVYLQSGFGYRTSGPKDMRPVGETEFATAEAEKGERLSGGRVRVAAAIVGPVDFTLGARIEPVLEAHIAAAKGRFRGVRGQTHWHEDPAIHMLANPPGILAAASTRDAIGVLRRLGLVLDAFGYFTQLDEVAALARAFPDLRIVVNHVGMPVAVGRYAQNRDEMFREWKTRVEALSIFDNIFMKLGGLGMRFGGFGFAARDIPPSSDDLVAAYTPYIATCIDAFGPDRCLFESNFPMDKSRCSYTVLWNAFKKISAGYSPEEKARMFSETAAEVYRIDLDS